MTPAFLASSNLGLWVSAVAAVVTAEGILYSTLVLARGWSPDDARGRRQLGVLWLASVPRLMVWLGLCGLYVVLAGSLGPGSSVLHRSDLPWWRERFVLIVSLLGGLSFVGRLLYLANRRLRMDAAADATHWERILAVVGGESLQIALPLAAAYAIVPLLGLCAAGEAAARRLVSLVLLSVVGHPNEDHPHERRTQDGAANLHGNPTE